MSKQPPRSRAKAACAPDVGPVLGPPVKRRATRSETLIALMRAEGGATAADLGAAIGWQVHSVRGFIAGTLKKRSDLTVITVRENGATRYRVTDAEGAAA
jgi:hypothetical protein